MVSLVSRPAVHSSGCITSPLLYNAQLGLHLFGDSQVHDKFAHFCWRRGDMFAYHHLSSNKNVQTYHGHGGAAVTVYILQEFAQ